ncbi:GNAT family N-acetyltransferase [Paenibacillus vini]|uniref:Aminoglycoside N(6')-acetyltransferase n=1 Tax=Paenibacillus vini TaxID=1476024 RepID=A0ABQ4M5U2_9BACL|nr:GNAT family protein [Paenibacillus vini]GIP51359.1 aminoglycoside N(6')-acetyltransferase [Paenibacillus vini]
MTVQARFLEGEQVYLRPIGAEDAEWYFHNLYDPETRRLTGTQRHFTKEGISAYIERKIQDDSSVLLLIALCENDELIGDIALQDIDPYNRNCNIRIAISSLAQTGKGYGTEALNLMLDYGFGILNMHRIELNVFDYNPRALHVYEKLGFKREGVQREALYYNHEYHDSITMGLLEDEFRARK